MICDIPQRLRTGGTIGIVAAASPPAFPEKTHKGIAYLEGKGFKVVCGESVTATSGYLAGTDTIRADDVNRMFADPEISAIFALRGGYGSSRILDKLDFRLINRNPKIFVGYSDMTALSMALLRRSGVMTFGGPMVAVEMQAGMDTLTERAFWTMLMERRQKQCLMDIQTKDVLCGGVAEGLLLGGNLAVLLSLIGTRYEPIWKGGILFIEDVGENVYKIDRMLMQLRQTRVFSKINAVLLGGFTAIPEDVPNRDLDEVVKEHLLPYGVPVVRNFPFGHTMPKVTLPFGARVRVDTVKRRVTVLQAVVR